MIVGTSQLLSNQESFEYSNQLGLLLTKVASPWWHDAMRETISNKNDFAQIVTSLCQSDILLTNYYLSCYKISVFNRQGTGYKVVHKSCPNSIKSPKHFSDVSFSVSESVVQVRIIFLEANKLLQQANMCIASAKLHFRLCNFVSSNEIVK